jgi:hypothetical protein
VAIERIGKFCSDAKIPFSEKPRRFPVTLPIVPSLLVASYEFLRATPPFAAWHLPSADDVEFFVSRKRQWIGGFIGGRPPRIVTSSARVGHTNTLIRVMAHEMVHLKQFLHRTETPNTEHNAEFRLLEARVCRYHGFDPKEF